MARPPIINGPRPVMRPLRPVQKAEDTAAKPTAPEAKPEAKPEVSNVPAPEPRTEASNLASTDLSGVNQPVKETPAPATPAAAAPVAQPEAKVEPKVEKKVERPAEKSRPKPKAKDEKQESNGSVGVIILSIVAVIQLGVIGYLLYDKFNTEEAFAFATEENEKAVVTFKNDIEGKLAEITHLQDSLRTVIAEKEALGQELSQEREKLAELESLKSQVRNKQLSINSLNNKLSGYKKEVRVVQASVGSLMEENKKLASEKEYLQQLIQTKDDSLRRMDRTKSTLMEKVGAASALQAENFELSVFNTGGKEMKGSNYKAMMVGNVKVNFNLSENSITDHGPKELYFRVIDPSGAVLHEGEKVFTSASGKKIVYTEKQTIEFDNTKQKVGFFYAKGSRYKAGKYMIEVFSDGKKMGGTSLLLKN